MAEGAKAILYHKGVIAGHVVLPDDNAVAVIMCPAQGLAYTYERRVGRNETDRKLYGADLRYKSASLLILTVPEESVPLCDRCEKPVGDNPQRFGPAVMCADCYCQGKTAHLEAVDGANGRAFKRLREGK